MSGDDADYRFTEYRVDGGEWQISNVVDGLNVNGLPIGDHCIDCRLRNAANKISDPHSIEISIGGWKIVSTRSFANYNGNSMAITPDGNLIAVPCTDGVELFDVSKLSSLNSFRLDDSTSHLAFSHDGQFLAAIAEGRLAVFGIERHRRLFYSAMERKNMRVDITAGRSVSVGPICLTYACSSKLLVATLTNGLCKGLAIGADGIPIKGGEFWLPPSTNGLKVLRSVAGTDFVVGGSPDNLYAWEFKGYDSPKPHALDASPLNAQRAHAFPVYPFPLAVSPDATMCFTARGIAAIPSGEQPFPE